MQLPSTYEYAGFHYIIDGEPKHLTAIPVQGQHAAASKEKHRRAAIECFLEDHGVKK